MAAIERLRRYRPMGSGAKRRHFTLSERDLLNLQRISERFEREGQRKPSSSLMIGAGLQLLRTLAEEEGAPVAWLER